MPADKRPEAFVKPFFLADCNLRPPMTTQHGDWWVARDDVIKGGTKARFLRALAKAHGWEKCRPICYYGPAQGGMQLALASLFGKDAHLFYGSRKVLAPRQEETLQYGAVHHYSPYPAVRPTTVRAFTSKWAEENNAVHLRWSLSYPEVVHAIARVMDNLTDRVGYFDEIWVAGGGGTLARGLLAGAALTGAKVHVVPIGRTMSSDEVPGATIHPSPGYKMDDKAKTAAPFPCDPYYDGKAWEYAERYARYFDHSVNAPKRRRLFWNVIAPPPEP